MALPDKNCATETISSTPTWDIGFSFTGTDNINAPGVDFSSFWLSNTPAAPEPDPVPPGWLN